MRVLLAALVVVFATLPVGAQPAEDPCADQTRVSAAVRRALTALGQHDRTVAAALRGCARAVACGAPPAPTRTACTMHLAPEEWGFVVTVVPRPANGAPAVLSVNVDSANDAAHRVDVSGNRWAVGRGVAIVGETLHRRHTHGGEPARLAWANFRAWNETGAALPLEMVDGVFTNNALARPLSPVTSQVTSLPPGESELEVGFPTQEAYQSWNNYFAARIRMRVAGQLLTPQAEFAVTRVTPLHR